MLLLILLLAAAADAAVPTRAKAFVGARVIDGSDAAPTENAAIIVRHGRIEAVGAKVAIPADAERIDLAGKTVIPGLISARSSRSHVRHTL